MTWVVCASKPALALSLALVAGCDLIAAYSSSAVADGAGTGDGAPGDVHGCDGCLVPAPSNVTATADRVSCGHLELDNGRFEIDTTSCDFIDGAVSCSGSVESQVTGENEKACVVVLSSASLSGSAVLRVAGEHPLVLLVETNVEIGGQIDAAGRGPVAGPGAGGGGLPASATEGRPGLGLGGGQVCDCSAGGNHDDCGGGGGGFGTTGGAGGQERTSCASLSEGGGPYGAQSLMPLVGGSGGASGNNDDIVSVELGAGGGGGGAVQISAGLEIRIDGAISLGGGGGSAGSAEDDDAAGGGGGSGGAVLLEAPRVIINGWVAANGGGGGGGADGGDAAGDGEDGRPDNVPAAGGQPLTSDAVEGGAGGVAEQQGWPAPGGDGYTGGGGGGGGGVGRVRVNARLLVPTNWRTRISGLVSTGSF